MSLRRTTDPTTRPPALDLDEIVAEFGRQVTRKLRTGEGSGEDHLRGPFEWLLSAFARRLGFSITMIGETRLPDLAIRPDYAVDVNGGRVGYVELKKPGHGVPGTWRSPSSHDQNQWQKFRLLPNVLYADGEQFARYEFGTRRGSVGRLAPALQGAGSKLRAIGGDFERLVTDFLLWKPVRPRSLDELVGLVANLCRLLRDDVAAELVREQAGLSATRTFTDLAMDWRQVLFPDLSDVAFADQYAQTVTFALLLARVEGVSFQGRSIGEIARLLGKKHTLMGRALTVLTDQPEEEHSIALTTLVRVLAVVDWSDFPDDSYAMLYEDFLAKYDPLLRRKSGVYYTPAALVTFTTRFVDEVLRTRLRRRLGFAERDVIVVDPAMGTGSFLAEVVNTVATTVQAEEGPGAVAAQLRDLSDRLIGFENQAASYAVAELRIHALLRKRHGAEIPAQERRFLADALADPDVQSLQLGRMYEAIERSRRGANLVKRHEPVMVVIGNPPYVDKVKGVAPWIEAPQSGPGTPSLTAFRKPGNGRLEYVLSNLYVYFWRWATWKVFDAHREHPSGVVAMVCSAGFTAGPGFAGMREYLRRTADEGWIVDLTPEGHQPPMATRFFRGNQQPICVAVFIRRGEPDVDNPARIRRVAVEGSVADKAAALDRLSVDGPEWRDCATGWTEPFQPADRNSWSSMAAMTDLLPWASPGVKPNRTWVYAPDPESLAARWRALVSTDADSKAELFRESRDANLRRVNPPLPGITQAAVPFAEERGHAPTPIRVGFRAFDRQWLIPDSRLIATPRPPLWWVRGPEQVFAIEQHAHAIDAGPGLVFSSLIPDMHCFTGRGGRVFPLYRDSRDSRPNVSPGLLTMLANELQRRFDEVDVLAYLAAVASHPGYTRRFAEDLNRRSGIRIPISRDASLWSEAAHLGREVIWLHTYGDRLACLAEGRPFGPPRMPSGCRPAVRVRISDADGDMPDRLQYDESTCTLRVGSGQIAPVAPEVYQYQVGDMLVVKHWFGYRKRHPSGRRMSPLDKLVATRWTASMTTELLDLLNVLGRCVALEPLQERLLACVLDGPLITVEDLVTASVLPVPQSARKAPEPPRQDGLFDPA